MSEKVGALLAKARQKLEGISNAWRNRTCHGQGMAAFLQVKSTFGDVREAAEARSFLNEALEAFDAAMGNTVAGEPPAEETKR